MDESAEAATLEEQQHYVHGFLEGLVDAFGVSGTVVAERVDDETLEMHVDGDDLGLLIGPKGHTLRAVQELSRTVVQRNLEGRHEGRIRVDIGRYWERRRQSLEAFSQRIAREVADSGVEKALEPMGSADRKVVHDAVGEVEGVRTISEGDEPRRRVVLIPDE